MSHSLKGREWEDVYGDNGGGDNGGGDNGGGDNGGGDNGGGDNDGGDNGGGDNGDGGGDGGGNNGIVVVHDGSGVCMCVWSKREVEIESLLKKI